MILVILFGVSINYNLNREVGNIKKKNFSTRIACRGSRLVRVMGRIFALKSALFGDPTLPHSVPAGAPAR